MGYERQISSIRNDCSVNCTTATNYQRRYLLLLVDNYKHVMEVLLEQKSIYVFNGGNFIIFACPSCLYSQREWLREREIHSEKEKVRGRQCGWMKEKNLGAKDKKALAATKIWNLQNDIFWGRCFWKVFQVQNFCWTFLLTSTFAYVYYLLVCCIIFYI